ncbi:MAG: adenylate/guanylate cyclase domain-containing protein [bacterium]
MLNQIANINIRLTEGKGNVGGRLAIVGAFVYFISIREEFNDDVIKMLCPNCKFDNPANFKYCGQCGTPLPASPLHERHQDLAAVPASLARSDNQIESEQAERRQLTVMFCDLVGSTALSSRLDPEDLRNILRAYHETCGRVIHSYDGHIAQYLGDGVLIYFGYPSAHEDDARRAVRTGLEIIEGIAALNARLLAQYRVKVDVRIGIHTGLVVVGAMGNPDKREALALGETPNLAARLQSLAVPNTVIISASTHRLVRGFFEYEDAGTHQLKGITQSVACYRVLRWSGAQGRLDVVAGAGLTPLIGKSHEMEILLQAWQKVQHGKGQTVLLQGEAGIGKSRVTRALKEQLAPAAEVLECQCSPYHQNSTWNPIIDFLQRLLNFQRDESNEKKLQKLENLFGELGIKLDSVVPAFAALLSVPVGERYGSKQLTPDREKQMRLVGFCNFLLRRSCLRPALLIVEDLHWADPSTLELLGMLMEKCVTARVLMLLTARPIFQHAWPASAQYQQIHLSRLNSEEVALMLAGLTREKRLPQEVAAQIILKTDGVPLFVEELTKMILESSYVIEYDDHYEMAAPLPAIAIPATLQDSLMARLDRLAAVKEVAQVAAVIGREFNFDLLRAVWPHDEKTLYEALVKLLKAELLMQQGDPPHDTYSFKHALIQDAAYESLLRSRRQFFHYRIAQALTEKFLDSISHQPELMAYHYTEAGMADTAVEYWLWAGQHAIGKSAHLEAHEHLRKGLELVQQLSPSAQRDQRELILLSTLGVTLVSTRGYAAPEVEEIYSRAWQLCEQLNDTRHSLPVLLGLWQSALLRQSLKQSLGLAAELMQLAQQTGDETTLLTAHLSAGISRFYHGDLILAREHLENALRLYRPERLNLDASMFGQDPGVVSLVFLANVLWYLGYPEQAWDKMKQALALAETLDHPFTRAFALSFTSEMQILLGEIAAAEKQVDALLTLAREQNFPFWLAHGTSNKGQILLRKGRQQQGIAYIEKAVAAFNHTGSSLGRAGALAYLAEEYCKLGKIENGLSLWREAHKSLLQDEHDAHHAELLRVHGKILQAQDRTAEAEASFQQALECARAQSAKAWELRAAADLARLWQKQGQHARALTLLSGVYGWFTEGFETKDLREAKVMLEELAG